MKVDIVDIDNSPPDSSAKFYRFNLIFPEDHRPPNYAIVPEDINDPVGNASKCTFPASDFRTKANVRPHKVEGMTPWFDQNLDLIADKLTADRYKALNYFRATDVTQEPLIKCEFKFCSIRTDYGGPLGT